MVLQPTEPHQPGLKLVYILKSFLSSWRTGRLGISGHMLSNKYLLNEWIKYRLPLFQRQNCEIFLSRVPFQDWENSFQSSPCTLPSGLIGQECHPCLSSKTNHLAIDLNHMGLEGECASPKDMATWATVNDKFWALLSSKGDAGIVGWILGRQLWVFSTK